MKTKKHINLQNAYRLIFLKKPQQKVEISCLFFFVSSKTIQSLSLSVFLINMANPNLKHTHTHKKKTHTAFMFAKSQCRRRNVRQLVRIEPHARQQTHDKTYQM